MPDFDVIVIGAGNAALAAAVSARKTGAKVLMLEKATEEERGGNTYFSGGLLRFAFDTVEQLHRLVPDAEKEYPGFNAGIEPYNKDAFRADLHRMTDGRTDPELSELLIDESYNTVCWMKEVGRIPMEPALSLGGVRVGNVIKWPKGAIIRAVHEGVGLSEHWFETAQHEGVEIRYESNARKLIQDARGHVCGVTVQGPDRLYDVTAKAVVLASGGFEANQAWRAQYLGRPWDHAIVRGTRHNQGDGLRMALEAGAMQIGQWSGCHATPINAEAAPYGVRHMTDKTNRLSYPYGVMVNLEGVRFLDEAPDFQFFTYAKYGGIILNQPGGFIYQFFDQQTVHLLEPRYSTSVPLQADTLEELVAQTKIWNKQRALKTLLDYNAAAGHGGPFNPGILDGLHTKGLDLPKSNWALALQKPPFIAYPVTGGITFSFGGLKVNTKAEVLGTNWKPIPGLYCCGEMVGNLFHGNYPGGSGLTSGATFGRIAGANAAGA